MTNATPLETEYETIAAAQQAADDCPINDVWANYRAVYLKSTGKFVFWRSFEGKYPIRDALMGKWILVAERIMRLKQGWQYMAIPQDAFAQLPPQLQMMIVALDSENGDS